MISTSRKYVWKFCILFCYAWKLLYHYTCFFSHQKKRRRFHSFIVAGGTAFWHLTVCGATGDDGVSVGVVGLTVFGLRCPINIIFTPVLLWYPHYWNVLGNLLYHIITVFLLFKLKTEGRRLDGFVVAGGTVGCHGDNLRCHRWHLGSLTFAVYGFLWFSVLDWYDIYTRFTVIATSLKCKRCFVSWFF